MKLARLGDPGHEKPVLITDSGTFDLSGIVPDLSPATFATGAIERIRAAERGDLPEVADAARSASAHRSPDPVRSTASARTTPRTPRSRAIRRRSSRSCS